ncbi:hypothetical protein Y032_0074g852 [Ancylostoma ceylanicum]|uniref:Uncharacterized protein n=1 Tax=Ancylostoma ceylanicum TaxID=53326 RepID=A0A016TV87_9BILA|nr:hypothetical protein Y032_0074g852 [Ancylostoma ceylanicum]
MDFPAPSSSSNFSSIARRLLLSRKRRKSPDPPAAILAQDMLGYNPDIEQYISSHPGSVECKASFQQAATLSEVEIYDVKPPNGEFTVSSLEGAICPKVPVSSVLLCERLQSLTTENLATLLGTYDVVCSTTIDTTSLSKRAKVLVRRVRQFFEELKRLLGDSCKGTVFDSPVEMTAMACGVSQATVRSLGVRPEFVHEPFPRNKKKPKPDQESISEATLRKYGEQWGKIVVSIIKENSKKENMTISALHKLLLDRYAHFPMSRTTLYSFTKAMGVTYERKRGISYMLL